MSVEVAAGGDRMDDTSSPRPAEAVRPPRRRWRSRLAAPTLTALLSLLAAGQALRLWEWRPGTPLGLTGDAPWVAALVRGYLEFGPYADNPLFGAPFALNTGWSSTSNDLHVWLITALGAISSDPFTVTAIYFVTGFPLAALSMYWLCRQYDVSRAAAVTAGVLFSVVPGQQERFVHLFLATYWAVPFAAWLLIETAAGSSVFSPGSRWRATGWRSRRPRLALGVAVLMCMSIGLGDVYYVAFTLVLALPVIALRQFRRVDMRELGTLLLPLMCVVLPTAFSLVASRLRADRDVLTGTLPWGRGFADTERWSGQLVDLLLPWSGHRLESWASRAASFDGITGTVGEVSFIGTVAVFGLVGTLVYSGALVLRHGTVRTTDGLVLRLSVLSVLSLAFFTRGGLGALTAILVTPQIRTWSRLFLFVALFGLLAVARALTKLSRRPLPRRGMAASLCLAVLCLGVLDQTNPDRAPDWSGNRAALSVMTQFDGDVARALGANCSVFVLPITDFPEVDDTPWREVMALAVASHDLRWSFGAIKGTQKADWQRGLPLANPRRLVEDLAAIGYCGVVEEASLSTRMPGLAKGLATELGPAVALSADRRFLARSLGPVRRTLEDSFGPEGVSARAEAALHPVVARLSGAWALGDLAERTYPLGPGPTVRIANMSGAPAGGRLTLDLSGPSVGVERLRISGGGIPARDVELRARERVSVSIRVNALPGVTTLQLSREGDGIRWSDFASPSELTAVQEMRLVMDNPAINVGVDYPSK